MQTFREQNTSNTYPNESHNEASFDTLDDSCGPGRFNPVPLKIQSMENEGAEISCISGQLSDALNISPTKISPFYGKNYKNLVSNSHVLFATDEWFARCDNLVKDTSPVFVPDLYCPEGKVMDGWETRRRRVAGHDWCVIALNSLRGDVCGIELDTAHFTGNQTPRVSIEVANCYNEKLDEEEWKFTWMPGAVTRLAQGGGIQGTGKSPKEIERAQKACEGFTWVEILGRTVLQPGYEETRMHYFSVPEEVREKTKGFTHIRVNYFPDGGVARMKLWGRPITFGENTHESSPTKEVFNVPPSFKPYADPELSCEIYGGQGLSCSNKHYGVPANLIRQGEGKDMGDGWETARHPDRPPVLIKDPKTDLIDSPLLDWAVIKLGLGGAKSVSRIILDTKHFKGNFPESVSIEGCDASCEKISDDIVCAVKPGMDDDRLDWFPLLKRSRMGPDREHLFDGNSSALVNATNHITHVRVSIFPDGGLSRVRIYGTPMKKT